MTDKQKQASVAGKIGGVATGKISRTCPHCGTTINGNVFFYHLKKCKVAEINNQKTTEQNEPLH